MFRFIKSMETGVVTTFGKMSRLAYPGLNIYIPIIQEMKLVSNRLCEKQCHIVVRTSDKVFPKLDITIQYKVVPEDSGKAFFEMAEPVEQMISYTDNIVRKVSSGFSLDDLFESQSHIADAILEDVGPKMKKAGFTIESAQIRNIVPPEEILKSMNDINASERRKIAARNDGEATKIKAVLMAEADAKEKELRGKGIALMRENITFGWVGSVAEMSKKTNTPAREVLKFLLKILQQETMESMAKTAGTKVIFVDKSSDL